MPASNSACEGWEGGAGSGRGQGWFAAQFTALLARGLLFPARCNCPEARASTGTPRQAGRRYTRATHAPAAHVSTRFMLGMTPMALRAARTAGPKGGAEQPRVRRWEGGSAAAGQEAGSLLPTDSAPSLALQRPFLCRQRPSPCRPTATALVSHPPHWLRNQIAHHSTCLPCPSPRPCLTGHEVAADHTGNLRVGEAAPLQLPHLLCMGARGRAGAAGQGPESDKAER